MSSRQRREALVAFAVVALTTAWLAAVLGARDDGLGRLEHPLHDLITGHLGEPTGHEDAVTVVLVDDDTLLHLDERWPLSRLNWARFMRAMAPLKPAAVGVDAWFEVPAPRASAELAMDTADRLRDAGLADAPPGSEIADELEQQAALLDGDRQFATAMAALGSVVLGVACQDALDEVAGLDGTAQLAPLAVPQGLASPALRCNRVATSIAPLVASARAQAGLQVLFDADGQVRRYPYVFGSSRGTHATLALALVRLARPGQSTALTARALQADSGAPLVRVPLRSGFRTLHFSDIVQAEADSRALVTAVRDRIVLVGVSAKGTQDFVQVPGERDLPGVYVHAAAVSALLGDGLVRREGRPVALALALGSLWLLLLVALGRRVERMPVALSVGACSAAAWLGVGVWMYRHGWAPPLTPLLAGFGLWTGGRLLLRLVELEEGRKRATAIRAAFSHYLAPAVIQELIDKPDRLKLGGERREITAFFSDVADFTAIAESLDPADLVTLINECLGAMSTVILEEGGTIDKYVGDAIVAMFGAPLDQPDHAERAVRAAMRCQSVVAALGAIWRGRGWPKVDVRIGLNTGQALVGNMGSRHRFDYTMIGDTVNLAARLEGVNKVYGCRIIVGPKTRELTQDAFVFRELDAIRVKGRHEAVRIFEPLAPVGEVDPLVHETAREYEDGLAAFRSRRTGRAREAFARCAAKGDGAASVFLARLDGTELESLPEDWDGVSQMTTK